MMVIRTSAVVKRLQFWLRQDFAFVFLGGLLMGLAPAPVNAWPLAWIALIPLWVRLADKSVSQNPPRKLHAPFLLGLVWGVGYHGLALSWITGVHPMTWMGVPWLASLAIALCCWVLITMWGATLVGLWAWGVTLVWHRKTSSPYLRILTGVALWCGLEAFWSLGPLLWTSLSYTQSPGNLPILHLSQLSGPLIVTAALVAANALLAEAWVQFQQQEKSTTKNLLVLNISLLIGLHLLGFGLYSRPLSQSPDAALRVGIIQGNIPNQIKLYPEGWRRAIEGYTTGYRTLADQGVDAILTPETALPFLWQEWQGNNQQPYRPTFYQAILEKKVIAWAGALGQQGQSITNSLFTVTGDGHIYSRYNKVKLVPLGEYIPFEQFLGSFIDRLSPLEAHMAAGESKQVFDTPFGRAIVGICYESAFSEHFRAQAAAGGQFILSPSNDAHYSASMPAQHHAQDVMRAIETDRWSVRATNTGYSGIVDPHGRTQWLSSLNTYALHTGTIGRRQTQTLYVRWGDWLTPLLLLLAGISWLVGARPSRTQF